MRSSLRWAARARWQLERTFTLANTGWPYGYGAGVHVTIANGALLLSRAKAKSTVLPRELTPSAMWPPPRRASVR